MPIRKQALDTTFSRHQICAVEKTAIKRPLETERIPPLIDDPRKALEVFGHAAWHDFREYRMPVIPVAGFLWLWLIGAWTDGFKKVRWLGSFGSRHMMMRFAILISLPLLILVSDHEMRAKKQSSQCILSIRNIQQAVRGHNGMNNINPGEKIDMPWDEIFGPER